MAPPSVSPAPIFPVLSGRVALITGASQGMGLATAEVFLKAGAKVVMADIQADEGEATAKELSSLGEVAFIKTDISKAADVEAMVAFAVEKFGRLDCAVNNAALTPDKNCLADMDEEYWRKLIDINLTGTALCVKYEMRQMLAQNSSLSSSPSFSDESQAQKGGAIVNIASINAFRPQPNMPAYTAAKHALIGLTKHAAMDGGPAGIRVNAVAPGAIFSDMSAAALEIMGTDHDTFAPQVSYLRRFGMAHEVAQGSLWLCSPSASYITGVALPIDGGYMAM